MQNYDNNFQSNQDNNHIENEEVDELIEWTQCLPAGDDIVDDN